VDNGKLRSAVNKCPRGSLLAGKRPVKRLKIRQMHWRLAGVIVNHFPIRYAPIVPDHAADCAVPSLGGDERVQWLLSEIRNELKP
jgi:hypothetical protein